VGCGVLGLRSGVWGFGVWILGVGFWGEILDLGIGDWNLVFWA